MLAVADLNSPCFAQATAERTEQSQEVLVRRISSEVLRRLKSDDWVAKQVELGIERYAAKVKEAQADAALEQSRKAERQAKTIRRVDPSRDHIWGDPNATVSLIEFSDFECPFCKRFHEVPEKLVDSLPAGELNLVFRHFPLPFHEPGARGEAIASECAAKLGGQKAFWAFADTVFKRTTSNGNGFPASQLVPLAVELKLDPDSFKHCLSDAKEADRVTQDVADGKSGGVTGTPTSILLNNRTGEVRLLVGSVDLAQLRERVNELLQSQSKEPVATR